MKKIANRPTKAARQCAKFMRACRTFTVCSGAEPQCRDFLNFASIRIVYTRAFPIWRPGAGGKLLLDDRDVPGAGAQLFLQIGDLTFRWSRAACASSSLWSSTAVLGFAPRPQKSQRAVNRIRLVPEVGIGVVRPSERAAYILPFACDLHKARAPLLAAPTPLSGHWPKLPPRQQLFELQ